MTSTADIIQRTSHDLLMRLWLEVETDSLGDDILFHARMYNSMGEYGYKRWKEHYQFSDSTKAIFEREDTPDDAATN